MHRTVRHASPSLAPGFPGRETTFPVLPTYERHPRVVAKSVSVRASTTRWRSRRTPKSRTCSAMSKQASKQRAGRHTRRDSSLGFGACGEPPGRPPVRVLNIRLPTILDALPARPRPSRGSPDGCYLVDPASSHMLVSKIKPCMCKYELIQTVKLRMAH